MRIEDSGTRWMEAQSAEGAVKEDRMSSSQIKSADWTEARAT
jgi:hypothetical protein